jgi:hypothetical protein
MRAKNRESADPGRPARSPVIQKTRSPVILTVRVYQNSELLNNELDMPGGGRFDPASINFVSRSSVTYIYCVCS